MVAAYAAKRSFAPCEARPEGFALWTPTAFEKAGETFSGLCRYSAATLPCHSKNDYHQCTYALKFFCLLFLKEKRVN